MQISGATCTYWTYRGPTYMIAAILEEVSRSQGDIWHQSNQCPHCHILPDITVFHPGPHIINNPCKVLKGSWTLYSFHKALRWQRKPWLADEVTGSQWRHILLPWRHTLCKCCPKPDLCHNFLVKGKGEWPGPGFAIRKFQWLFTSTFLVI